MDIKVAVLVDGSFYLNRLLFFKRKYYPSSPDLTPEQIIWVLNSVIKKHLNSWQNNYQHLYRVFYYDAPPLDIKAHYPLPENGEKNGRSIDFSQKDSTIQRKKY